MEFQIKCHLGYEVSGPASFLFNVAVAQNSFQRTITEHLEVGGAEYCQEMAIGGQRYHRVTAQSGPVELVYDAVVDATHEVLGDPITYPRNSVKPRLVLVELPFRQSGE